MERELNSELSKVVHLVRKISRNTLKIKKIESTLFKTPDYIQA